LISLQASQNAVPRSRFGFAHILLKIQFNLLAMHACGAYD